MGHIYIDCTCQRALFHFPTMRALILTSTLVAIASANTCTDCTAVVNAIVEASISDESINTQQAILVGALCPGAEDPAQCEAGLPDFWKAIALRLWPAYYNPEAEWMCGPTCANPSDDPTTCEECCAGLQASLDQLVDPRTIDAIVERFVASDFCSTIPDERCPEFLEAVLREGIPILVAGNDPSGYPGFCDFALPGTCPQKHSIF